MALFSCPECKRKISDQANTCPHCGYPLMVKTTDEGKETYQVSISGAVPANKGKRNYFVILAIFVIVAVAVVSIMLLTKTPTSSEASKTSSATVQPSSISPDASKASPAPSISTATAPASASTDIPNEKSKDFTRSELASALNSVLSAKKYDRIEITGKFTQSGTDKDSGQKFNEYLYTFNDAVTMLVDENTNTGNVMGLGINAANPLSLKNDLEYEAIRDFIVGYLDHDDSSFILTQLNLESKSSGKYASYSYVRNANAIILLIDINNT